MNVALQPRRARVDIAAVGLFLVVAFGAAWLIIAPLWWSGRGLRTPGAAAFLLAMMIAPTLGVLAVALLRRRRGLLDATGVRSTGGIRSWWRWAVLAWVGPLVLSLLALALSAALGTYHPDLAGFSGLAAQMRAAGAPQLPIPLAALAALQVAGVLVAGWLNVIPALAEEWGWRGWLLPALLPLGRWPAILLVGVVWGLWHAPVLLLGYNFPLEPAPLRLALMVGFCTVLGSLLGWLRIRTGSVWPGAIAHGFVNASGGAAALFSAAGMPVDNATVGLLGWPGWVVMALALAAVAAATRRRAPRD